MGKQVNLLGKDAEGNDQGLINLVDGAVPQSLMLEVKRIYREVEGIDSWSQWCGRLAFDAMRRAAEHGFVRYSELGMHDMAKMSCSVYDFADLLVRRCRLFLDLVV
jgi:hypothetical protein